MSSLHLVAAFLHVEGGVGRPEGVGHSHDFRVPLVEGHFRRGALQLMLQGQPHRVRLALGASRKLDVPDEVVDRLASPVWGEGQIPTSDRLAEAQEDMPCRPTTTATTHVRSRR
jgi:hypothetical protein